MNIREDLQQELATGHPALTGIATLGGAGLALLVLEVAHVLAVQSLSGNGFASWGDNGYFVRFAPGVALSLTSLPGQGAVFSAAFWCGLALGALALLGLLLRGQAPRPALIGAGVAALIFLPLALSGIGGALATEPTLTIDLVHDAITVPPGNYLLSVSGLAQFDTYSAVIGVDNYDELGAASSNGQVFDLDIAIPTAWGHSHYWESQHLIGALQEFVASKGQSFPT